MLDLQIDWTELAYICAVNIVVLWLVIKIENKIFEYVMGFMSLKQPKKHYPS